MLSKYKTFICLGLYVALRLVNEFAGAGIPPGVLDALLIGAGISMKLGQNRIEGKL